MGKFIKVEDRQEQQKKAVEAHLARMLKWAKEKGIALGDSMVTPVAGKPNHWNIWVENNSGGFADDMAFCARNHPTMQVVSHNENKGQFDWAADTYIKDSSELEVKF